MRQRRIARVTVIGLFCLVGASIGACGSDHEGGNHTVPAGNAGTDGHDPVGSNAGTGGNGGGSGTGNVGNAGTGSGGSSFIPGGAAHVRLVLKEVH